MEAAEGIRVFTVIGISAVVIIIGGGILWVWNMLR